MHGCPPDEVEKIGRYFIEERGFDTTIKLNPTLLGPRRLRHILNEQLGFDVQVPDEAFGHDLKYDDGLSLVRSLQAAAREKRVAFSLKLTNTLETANTHQNLPANEPMVYMSGRALHPVSIALAARLQQDFGGALDISFSAGVDCFNVVDTLACGLRPVTVCSDVLKPGGYGRLSQYLEIMAAAMQAESTADLDGLVCGRAGMQDLCAARLANLKGYAARVEGAPRYTRAWFPYGTIKTPRPLPLFDCADAPCRTACAADQDIPRYLDYTARGEYEQAWRVILDTNPFPNVQGMVCDHLCQGRCTRMNLDAPLMIREIKRFVAHKRKAAVTPGRLPANGLRVAVIGAGPTGMSCAWFLAMAGFEVHVCEAKGFAGGMAADGIPAFRLDDGSLRRDIDAILAAGVRLHTGVRVDAKKFAALRRRHEFVYVAMGAQESIALGIPGEDARGVLDQLHFLSAVRRGKNPGLGRRVAVVGGGNAAIDVARTAKRLVGREGEVSIIYRRTRSEMPCDPEELAEALEEGIVLHELTQPECMLVEDGRVASNLCFRMRLGGNDASGRPRPVRIEGSEFELDVDTVIRAIGQRVVLDFLPGDQLHVNPETLETQLQGVFAGGDAVRGASSLVNAIGDGRRAAEAIIKRAGLGERARQAPSDDRCPDLSALRLRLARRVFGPQLPRLAPEKRLNFDLYVETLEEDNATAEARRCLQCDLVCNVCVSVCPNRANLALAVEPMNYPLQEAVAEGESVRVETLGRETLAQPFQVVNIADFCNQCGNCDTFCPTSGAPYRDKFKLHLSRQSFTACGEGFYFPRAGCLEALLDGKSALLTAAPNGFVYEDDEVRAVLSADSLEASQVVLREGVSRKDLRRAAETAVFYRMMAGHPLCGAWSGERNL
jgi:putative selenate reductase